MPGLTRHPSLHFFPLAPRHMTRVRRTADNITNQEKHQHANNTQRYNQPKPANTDTGETRFSSPQTPPYTHCVFLQPASPHQRQQNRGDSR